MTKYIKIFCSRLCIAYILTLIVVAASLFFCTTKSWASSPASQNYNYSITSQNAYPSFTPGSSYNFTISVRNTGSATWQKNQVNLGTSRGQDRIPGFIREGDGPSGWISPNRIAFQESSVAPGGTATYSFWMKAPSSMPAGTYREYFQVVADGAEWMFDYGIYWDVRVVTGIDSYQYTISSQNAYPTLYANQSYNFIIRVVNTGYVLTHTHFLILIVKELFCRLYRWAE